MLRPLTREDELKQDAEELERDLTCSDYELELTEDIFRCEASLLVGLSVARVCVCLCHL